MHVLPISITRHIGKTCSYSEKMDSIISYANFFSSPAVRYLLGLIWHENNQGNTYKHEFETILDVTSLLLIYEAGTYALSFKWN